MEYLAEEILNFWIGPLDQDGMPDAKLQKRWFTKDPDFDKVLANRFGQYMETAGMGAYDRWASEPRGRVAEVILLDQFPRNLYRDKARAFYYDAKALHLCWFGLEKGEHLELPAVYAYFLLMPTMHSELLDVQQRGVKEFGRLRDAHTGPVRTLIENGLDYAEKHLAIIERFGRFPHRNAALGRESTVEELEFLKGPGSRF